MSRKSLLRYLAICLTGLITGSLILYNLLPGGAPARKIYPVSNSADDRLNRSAAKAEIIYGRELIMHTSTYLGPKGSVAAISNGMNCGNCHLEAGTRNKANPYVNVAATYPRFRARSGIIESISFRVNDCLQRSLNGKELDTTGKEMAAMVAYIKWTAHTVEGPANKILPGTPELPLLMRAASPSRGKEVFAATCASCHGLNGEGQALPDSIGYRYPPLWGNHSYNVSAGMFMISKLASFIKFNMPYSEHQGSPVLTDEQCWDVAAYVNSQERPKLFFREDWPKLALKPSDYPFGPYADRYSENQHKYGPYGEMREKTDKQRQQRK